ncbi:MAG: tagatose-6-phosphate kinase [Lachnospiraceae bacterium]|nr:tagatose-6-phosphate kinase [Lachnospiraceae bacterium]
MIRDRLERLVAQKRTILGVGPMSTNCIDSAIEISNTYEIPILLIASRRQIDSEEFGGGYVNNWTTSDFSEYVFAKDMKGLVYLCRDHGGPWQNPSEKESNLGLKNAMDSAKLSYKADIEAGFQILHIDPSIDIHGNPSMQEIVDRVLELYEYCWMIGEKYGRKLEFEIGTEEQSGSTSSAIEFEKMLQRVNRYCDKYHMNRPLFAVVQNGTKVIETRNVGSFDAAVRVAEEVAPEIQIPLMEKICQREGVMIKAHNTDYLSDDSLRWYPRLGIHAANVAPEFGVVETKALMSVMRNNGLYDLEQEFIDLVVRSSKWKKWMAPDSEATDRERAEIAGHYIYSQPEFSEIKSRISDCLRKKGEDLDEILKEQIKKSILRFLVDFRMVDR